MAGEAGAGGKAPAGPWPDVLGLDLAAAELLLKEAGTPYRVLETAPPRGVVEGPWKVMGQKPWEQGCVLLACRVPDPFRE